LYHCAVQNFRMVQLSGRSSKIVYLLLMLATVILAILLKFAFESHLTALFSFGSCSGGEGCLGNQAVYRVSFGSALGFLLFSLFTALHPPFHYRHWAPKLLVFCGFIIFPFFVPNNVFDTYAEIARVISIFFLLLQLFLLIDLAYDVHQYLLENKIEQESGEQGNWQVIYLVLAFSLIIMGIVGIGLLFHFYGHCPLHQFFIAFTLILGLIIFMISVTEKAGVGLLVPSVVFTYCVYVTWKAVFSNPDQECNPRSTSYDNAGMLIVGLIITATSLTYTSWSAGVSAPNLFRKQRDESATEDDPNAVNMGATPAAKMEKGEASTGTAGDGVAAGAVVEPAGTETEPKQFRNHWSFHLIMGLGAIFMSMLLTNWGQHSGGDKDSNSDVSIESMWIQIVTVWVTYVLFLWTVVAPCLCPDREFGDGENPLEKKFSNKDKN